MNCKIRLPYVSIGSQIFCIWKFFVSIVHIQLKIEKIGWERRKDDYPTLVSPGPPHFIFFPQDLFHIRRPQLSILKTCNHSFMFRGRGDHCSSQTPRVIFRLIIDFLKIIAIIIGQIIVAIISTQKIIKFCLDSILRVSLFTLLGSKWVLLYKIIWQKI